MTAPAFTIGTDSGPPNARTDPETGMRFYAWQGRMLPSVTTVRRMAGMPHKLATHQVSKVVQRATDEFETMTAMMTREARKRERVTEKNRIAETRKWLRAAATEERDAAAKLGTAVHDAAAAGFAIEDAEPAVQPRLRQFRHWLDASGCDILATEFQVFNLTAGYAGTVDFIGRFPDGSLWTVDLKTGNGIYSEHVLQLMAYTMAEFAGTDDVVDDIRTRLLRQVSGMAILHLADDGWEFVSVRGDREAWTAFRGLLAFATWTLEHDDVMAAALGSRKGHA
jgi:hypothetical protein